MPKLIVTDGSYKFVPPQKGTFWLPFLRPIVRRHLRTQYRIADIEVRGADKLAQLIQAGHGILLTPNHCRMSDALILQALSAQVRNPFFVMASSHLFRGNPWMAWALRKLGAFSVYREGVDRAAVKSAIDILTEAKRPLIIFPEGALSRANDRLNALMDGVSFMAHAAARKAAKLEQGKQPGIVVLPVAIKYFYKGEIHQAIDPLLERIETRLLWAPQNHLPPMDRILKIGHALITLKEIEYFGKGLTGEPDERLHRLIDHLLVPMEKEWLKGNPPGTVISRVKELRKAVVPDMIDGDLSEEETNRRWRQLQEMDLAQQMSLYPRHYLASRPTVDRLIETLERIEETLSGTEATPPPMTALIQVGEPIAVTPGRSKDSDHLLSDIASQLQGMLDELAGESRLFETPAASSETEKTTPPTSAP